MANRFVGVRGSRVLNEEGLRSHLAPQIQLENVAVIVGAAA